MYYRKRGCCSWEPEADILAAEKIREKALKRPLGCACKSLPLHCFSRGNISGLYTTSFILVLVGICLLIPRLINLVEDQESSFLERTQCTTISSNLSASMLSCNTCEDKNTVCKKNYPCLMVNVSYQAAAEKVGNSILYGNVKTMEENRPCLLNVTDCQDFDPVSKVNSMYQDIGSVGAQYDCYYNKKELQQVSYEKVESKINWGPIIPGICLPAAGILFLIFTIITCPCYHIYSKTPPPEIVEELQRRRAQVQQQQPMGQQGPFGPQVQFGQQHGQLNPGFGQDVGGFRSENYSSAFTDTKSSNFPPAPPSYSAATTVNI